MLIALLDALSKTTDKLVINNLQAQVYLSFTLFKISMKRNGELCIDEGRLLLTVNRFCITPSDEHKNEISRLIEDIKTNC